MILLIILSSAIISVLFLAAMYFNFKELAANQKFFSKEEMTDNIGEPSKADMIEANRVFSKEADEEEAFERLLVELVLRSHVAEHDSLVSTSSMESFYNHDRSELDIKERANISYMSDYREVAVNE